MSAAVIDLPGQSRRFRPPAPIPHAERMNPLQLLLAIRRNPVAAWGVWHFEEPYVQANTPLLGHTLVVNDPAMLRHVLVDNVANYPKSDLARRVLAPAGAADGLLTSEGEAWRKMRRTLAPIFAPRNVDMLADAILAKAETAAARMAETPVGGRVDVAAEMARTTFEVMSATLFSDGITQGPEAFGKALNRFLETMGRVDPLDLMGAPDWIPRFTRLRGRDAVKFFETEVAATIAKRRAEAAAGNAPHDLLTLLIQASDPETGLGIPDEEVASHVITFIVAGHETTSNALSWTLYLLAKHPDVREKVEAEARDAERHPVAEWPDRLVWTRAVIEEAMRLYPPASTLSRKALAADRIGDAAVPEGALVIVSPYLVHRHKRLWKDADYFCPERFLPGARETIDRFQYLPFGQGPRVCIGQRFAMLEAVVILSTIVKHVRLDWPARQPLQPLERITLRPDPGLSMIRA
ncbi:MAG: cytochrome P450 [Beijerinckiaceae bacterium]